jgi:hypothetical protein
MPLVFPAVPIDGDSRFLKPASDIVGKSRRPESVSGKMIRVRDAIFHDPGSPALGVSDHPTRMTRPRVIHRSKQNLIPRVATIPIDTDAHSLLNEFFLKTDLHPTAGARAANESET